jgi:hypothetical protein
MARAQDDNSANSQFFIVFLPRFSLDRRYTNFGRVIGGMDGVDEIERGEPPANPTTILQASIAADQKPQKFPDPAARRPRRRSPRSTSATRCRTRSARSANQLVARARRANATFMRVDLFDFELPPERIALRPARPRDAARLLLVPGDGPFGTSACATCRGCCARATCWCSTTRG